MERDTTSSGKQRPIAPDGFALPADHVHRPGQKPLLKWIAIADLVVDDVYQRPIYGVGRTNVRRIASAFSWSCFAPVIVASVKGGKFAVIDGQHRATAAAVVGIKLVPCQIVEASQREQAKAFSAINGLTTKMSRQAVHVAAVAAGDKEALEIEDVCRIAGVELLRYPIAANLQTKPGQTMAIGCVADMLKLHGRDTLITALQCVTETENNIPGALIATVIRAICDVLARNQRWRESGGKLLEAFDLIDIAHEMEMLWGAPRAKGLSAWQSLSQKFETLLRAEWRSAA